MTDTPAFDEHSHAIQSVDFDYRAAESVMPELREFVQEEVKQNINEAVWEGISRFAVEVMNAPDPKLTVKSFAFAAGLYVLEGKSQTDIAKECGVTRAAVSRRVVHITEALGLPPSRGMKSEQSREVYRRKRLSMNGCATHKPMVKEATYLTWIQKAGQYFNAHSPQSLNSHGRRVLKRQLKPLRDLYESL